MDEFSTKDAIELLRLLHKYVKTYTPDIPQTILALVEDIEMSVDWEPRVSVWAKEIKETEEVS